MTHLVNWYFRALKAMVVFFIGSMVVLVLGNVIGLNPFHDYSAWRLVIASSEVAARSPNGLDYGARLAAIEAELREQHRLWKSEQPRG